MAKPTTPARRPSQCHVSNCLGHPAERTAAVTCTRCQGQRWTLVKPASAPDPIDYVCIRCRAVLAGRNAADPLPSPETLERLARARQSQPGGFLKRVEPPAISGAAGDALRLEERLAERPEEPPRPRIEPYRYPTIPWDQDRTLSLSEPDRVTPRPSRVTTSPRTGRPFAGRCSSGTRYCCLRCGESKRLEAHHIRPRALGGSDDFRNLMTLCFACHNYVEPDHGPA